MRRRRLAVWVSASVLALVVSTIAVLFPPGTAAAAVNITPIREIGGPGHADAYPWGIATTNDGRILIADYWNWRVSEYNTNGTLSRHVVGPNFSGPAAHAAPYGVAVDPRNGDLWFGDVDSGATVDKYTSSGVFIRSAGGPSIGAGPNRFRYPAYVAVMSNGNLVVADSRDHNIVVMNPNGQELYQFSSQGSGPGQVNTPRGVAICHRCDSQTSDLLYVADVNNRRVDQFRLQHAGTTSSAATFIRSFGSAGTAPGRFGGDMRGIAVDEVNGWVYVVDASNGFVSKFTLTGGFLFRFGGLGVGPGLFQGGGRGVTVDHDGNVWVADMPDFRAQKFTPNGQFILATATAGPPDGGFNTPAGVAVDADGEIFVSDQRNWRIQKFAANGTYLSQWGSRGGGPYGLNYARGIAVDAVSGAVYVADMDNNAIKKYTNAGVHVWTATGHKAYQIDVGPDGRVYVADWETDRIKVLSGTTGGLLSQFGPGQMLNVRGIGIDPVDNSIWVADGQRGNVQHYSPTGAFLGSFGSPGSGPSQIGQAGDVEVDANSVYVSDTSQNLVKVWSKLGVFDGAFGGTGSTLGRFLGPWGMDLTPAGRLYVVDQTGERVQEFAVTSGGNPGPDTTAPTLTLTSPTANQTLPLGPITLSGTAADNVGVTSVRVLIRNNATNQWWNGTGWGPMGYVLATVASPGSPNTGWTYVFNAPTTGSYAFRARSVDAAGNLSPAIALRTFNVG